MIEWHSQHLSIAHFIFCLTKKNIEDRLPCCSKETPTGRIALAQKLFTLAQKIFTFWFSWFGFSKLELSF